MGQLSFYSAEARQPCVGDLAGLLCGPGRALGFARGRAARVSVTVDTRDRAAAVVAALAERGVQARSELVRTPVKAEAEEDGATPDEPGDEPVAEEPAELESVAEGIAPGDPLDEVLDDPVDDEPDGFAPVVIGSGRSRPAAPEPDAEVVEPVVEPGPVESEEPKAVEPEFTESWQVTTAFRTDLAGLAAHWLDGDRKVVPPEFTLDGAALRLWALASGRWVESGSGYLLGLDPEAPDTHEALRKALATSGLPSTLLTGRAGGPALRVVGRRRLERLAELVGRAPRGVAERTWPAA
ncbi:MULTISPECIES: hypothetical protein [Saccharothrix]|uniref:hypothetical protein n=1 Tax=Saccharothrix TaxID=2071 RepID=UPI0018EA1638|nr:hypothetical protein [Saccharothrix sp. CB00851]